MDVDPSPIPTLASPLETAGQAFALRFAVRRPRSGENPASQGVCRYSPGGLGGLAFAAAMLLGQEPQFGQGFHGSGSDHRHAKGLSPLGCRIARCPRPPVPTSGSAETSALRVLTACVFPGRLGRRNPHPPYLSETRACSISGNPRQARNTIVSS